jgi:hypothetical protein
VSNAYTRAVEAIRAGGASTPPRPSIADAVAMACAAESDKLGRDLTDAEHGCIRAGYHAGLSQTMGSVPRSGIAHEVYVHCHHALRALQRSGTLHPDDEGIAAARERLGVALVGLRMWDEQEGGHHTKTEG